MQGYHYLPFEKYKKVQEEGLVPYSLHGYRDFAFNPPEQEKGIWVFKNKPTSKDHLFNLIRCLSKHKTTDIVLIEVLFSRKDLMRFALYPGSSMFCKAHLAHTTSIEQFVSDKASTAYVLKHPVAPENISLIGYYDMLKLTQRPSKSSLDLTKMR